MAEATIPKTTDTEKAGRWATIKSWFAEMDRLHAEIERDQSETHQLSLEIEANLAETKIVLDRLATT